MNPVLSNIAKDLKSVLAKSAVLDCLRDEPWTISDGHGAARKLIFKSKNELLASDSGKVRAGRWAYLPRAQSIHIGFNDDEHYLYNVMHVDNAALVLQLDGTNQFLSYFNPNEISKDKLLSHLRRVRHKNLRIERLNLKSGRTLEVFYGRLAHNKKDYEGLQVQLDGKAVKKEVFHFKGKDHTILCHIAAEVIDSKITRTFYSKQYKVGNDSIEVWQSSYARFFPDDRITINGDDEYTGKYRFSKSKLLDIDNGRITNIKVGFLGWF